MYDNLVFLGAPWVLRENSHIVIDFVIVRFSERARHNVSIVMHVLAVLLCAFLFWQAADYTYEVWRKGMATPYPIVFPLVYMYILMPLGFIFLTIEFIIQTWELVSKKGRGAFCFRKGEAAVEMKTMDM
ncbi:MAG: TRAP transporter small permease [Firmicutes bacterium]|nr:TRAP transporter small permease [Bacillota bacterium]